MANLHVIIEHLGALLRADSFNDFCLNGLQVEGRQEVARLAVAVSASLAAISRAVEWGADLLVVHHGLFWNRDKVAVVGSMKEKLALLLKGEVSLAAYHLPLDAHVELGNNWGAARQMGWAGLTAFPAKEKQPIGVLGGFSARPIEQFHRELEAYYQRPIEAVYGGKKMVSSAALISGGAHRSIVDAEGVADCFITGSRDEPTWHQSKELRVNFFAVGHSSSERVGPLLLGDYLAKQFDLSCQFIEEDNPF